MCHMELIGWPFLTMFYLQLFQSLYTLMWVLSGSDIVPSKLSSAAKHFSCVYNIATSNARRCTGSRTVITLLLTVHVWIGVLYDPPMSLLDFVLPPKCVYSLCPLLSHGCFNLWLGWYIKLSTWFVKNVIIIQT